MAEYAGESLAKKVARVRLYTRVRETLLFSNRNLDNTKVLFLPGPDASEVGALKHILKVKPQNVIGVDIDGDACDALTKKWPETNVIQGDLSKPKTFNKALRDIKSYGEFDGFDFIHLDLMGILKRDSELLYGMWACYISPWTREQVQRERECAISTEDCRAHRQDPRRSWWGVQAVPKDDRP
jgi:hypothetical protein